MASLALIEAEVNSLPPPLRVGLMNAFREALKSRFGRGTPGASAENFFGGFFQAVTPSTPGDEFSVPHTFGTAPYLAIGVLPLSAGGWSTVPLTTTKAADAKRAYFSSSVANATILLYMEG